MLGAVQTVLALDSLTRGDIDVLAVIGIRSHNGIELIGREGGGVGALVGKTARTDKIAQNSSDNHGHNGDGNGDLLALATACSLVFLIVVFLIVLGHEVLVCRVLGHLALGTLGLFLGGSASGHMLSGGTLYELHLVLVDIARSIATADNLDAVDLFTVVFLLNQTHIVCILLIHAHSDCATQQ